MYLDIGYKETLLFQYCHRSLSLDLYKLLTTAETERRREEVTDEERNRLLALREKVNKVKSLLAAGGSGRPGPRSEAAVFCCQYFHVFPMPWKRISSDRGNTLWCKECKKSKKR